MSYCGTCGGFYSPECARRADGICSPAMNPHVERELVVRSAIAYAETRSAALQAENFVAVSLNREIPNGPDAFRQIAEALRDIMIGQGVPA